MDEFALIRRYFQTLTPVTESVSLGIGDDCALLRPPPGFELAMTTDTLIAGRHFPLQTAPGDIGWKSLAVSLSDLAAMGAQPLWFLLALTLPAPDAAWLEGFAKGLKALADETGIALVGGDTTRGPLSVTITAMGSVPAGAALRRSGAKTGDIVCVTGTLGDAALALAMVKRVCTTLDSPEGELLRTRLDRPTPRVSTGLALRGIANAAVDLSDGLAGDLQHVLDASGVGADIDVERLPMSSPFARHHAVGEALPMQAAGGDDYELCVCIPPSRLAQARAATDVKLTEIGRITAEPGLRLRAGNGSIISPDLRGYRHFHD